MELPQEAIKEFTDIYHKCTGRVLDVDEAMDRAYRFLGLYVGVLGPNRGVEAEEKIPIGPIKIETNDKK